MIKTWKEKIDDRGIPVKICRYCENEMERIPIKCPDGRIGCAVAHYKLQCKNLCEYIDGN